MERRFLFEKKYWGLLALAAVAALVCAIWWTQVALAATLLVGGAVIAFLLSPLCNALSAHMPRTAAVFISFAAVFVALAGAVLLLLPALIGQISELIEALPGTFQALEAQMERFADYLVVRGLPNLSLPDIPWQQMLGSLQPILNGTVSAASSVVNTLTQLSLMMVLGFYFLKDHQRLLLHLELMIPAGSRRLVLHMASSVRRELHVYLRGQLLIALIVGVLAAAGLAIIGMRSFLVLGLITGILNLVPYFGPVLGAIPAVLLAFPQGWFKALMVVVVMVCVQQIDGMIISPRVLGSATGLNPAAVLIAISVGGSMGGIKGMLFALPVLLILRSCLRVWVQRDEIV